MCVCMLRNESQTESIKKINETAEKKVLTSLVLPLVYCGECQSAVGMFVPLLKYFNCLVTSFF